MEVVNQCGWNNWDNVWDDEVDEVGGSCRASWADEVNSVAESQQRCHEDVQLASDEEEEGEIVSDGCVDEYSSCSDKRYVLF